MAVVIDASIALGWVVPSQATPLTEIALAGVAADYGVVPPYFGIEIARVLRNHERRKLLSAEVVDLSLAYMRGLRLREDDAPSIRVAQNATILARQYDLRIADAAYLELALRTGFPLATRDAALARAAETADVKLFKS
jgi:predicted nucleic acid-binding protein